MQDHLDLPARHDLEGLDPVADLFLHEAQVLAMPANRPSGRHVRCAVELLVKEARGAVESGAWPEGRWLGA
ncbi:hypothetical protein [Variovorax guangxiensis]|uniref:hypothetical protein n=1 Tax=Variovorax guangxiensis TaxID=1775474 RepID=UPI00285FB882|nr:hypothetical protein [Variovorax guangxiensis]MDR6855636.1 hypothetical protein [Variovorax guangxiensis]